MSTITPVPTYPSEGWLLDEDRALRDLMKGIKVSDGSSPARAVEAWFGHPDIELREQKYPYITVDLLEIQEGLDRVHRGDLYLGPYPAPHGMPEWWGFPELAENEVYSGEMPTPVDLIYQVGTWARNPRHDRQMLRALITKGRTSLRAGVIATADGYTRRLDFLGQTKRDREEGGKRLFNNVFRLRMSSEVLFGGFVKYGPVESVHLSVGARDQTGKISLIDSETVTDQ